MIVRPSYVYWLHPDSEKGWHSVPQSVRNRCDFEQAGSGNLVHWHDANSKPYTNEIAEQITRTLAEVTEFNGWDLGLSVLFVWNGVNSKRGFLDECLEKTEEFLSVFRQVIDSNIGQYQQLGNSSFEILIKLPRTGFVFGEPDNQRRSQKQWLEKMKKFINPSDNLYVPLSRVWLLGNNNIGNQHRSGITIATDIEHEQLAAEVISFWLDSDLDSIIYDAQIASEPYLSIGVSRLIFETEKCVSALSKKMGIRLLEELLNEDSKKPDPEKINAFLSTLPIAPDIRGLDVKILSDLFLNPRKLISNSQDTTMSDLGGQILFNFDIDLSDIDDIEKSLSLPAALMLQGQMLISRRIFDGMIRVRECRYRAFDKIILQLNNELDKLTKSTEDAHVSKLVSRMLMWKTWISDQSKLVKGSVNNLMRTDASSSTQVEDQLNMLFQNVKTTPGLVPEDKPDPKLYADKLSDLLSKRPLEEAFITRSIIGGVGCTWALFHFVSLFDLPISIWLFTLPGRVIISSILPVIWGLMTFFKLMKYKKRRENAFQALMISIIKNGKWLFRDFISKEMSTIYSELGVYIGSEGDLVDYNTVNAELHNISSRKTTTTSSVNSFLTKTLLSRAGKLRSTLRKAITLLGEKPEDIGIEDSKWVQNLTSYSITDKLPFLVKPVSKVSIDNEPSFDTIFDSYSLDRLPLHSGLSLTEDAKELESTYADTAWLWAKENGFAYLSDQASIGMIIDFMLDNDGNLLKEWREFLEKAAYPYFNIGSNSTHQSNIGIIQPKSMTKRLTEIIKHFPDKIGAESWIGTPGIIACSIQGPVDSTALSMLPVKFPELISEPIDVESSEDEKVWEV